MSTCIGVEIMALARLQMALLVVNYSPFSETCAHSCIETHVIWNLSIAEQTVESYNVVPLASLYGQRL